MSILEKLKYYRNAFGNQAANIVKKIITYYSKTFGGRYFKNVIFSDQIEVLIESFREGRVSVKELNLNAEHINSQFTNLPFELVDGYIAKVDADVPVYQFFEVESNINVVITGAEITLKPKQTEDDGLDAEQMFDSMVNSMHMVAQESTAQIAEECRQEVTGSHTEGAEMIAAFINNGIKKLKITLKDTVIRVEHKPSGAEKGIGLEFHIKSMEFFDDSVGTESSGAAAEEGSQGASLLAWDSAKVLTMTGISVYMDDVVQTESGGKSESDDSLELEGLAESLESMASSQMYQSARSSLTGDQTKSAGTSTPTESHLIQVAVLTGQQRVKLHLNTTSSQNGPKLEVDAQLGALHVLLSPQQFHGLLDVAQGFSSPDSSGTASGSRGQRDKPMEAADFALVEQTLQADFTHPEEPFSSSPYMTGRLRDFDPMTQSVYGEDMFSSMHQGPQYAESVMTQSASSVCSNTTNRSSGTTTTVNTYTERDYPQRSSRAGKSPHDNLKKLTEDPAAEFSRYHLKTSFISVSLLHEDPPGSPGDLGPMETLRSISEHFFSQAPAIGFQGMLVSAAKLRSDFSEALPYDHIGFLAKPLTLECSQGSAPKLRSLKLDLSLGICDVTECLFDRRNCTASLEGFHLPIAHKLPDYVDLLVFKDVEGTQVDPFSAQASMVATVPAVRIKILNTQNTRRPSRHEADPCTSVEVALKEFYSELDVTIADRLSALLTHSRVPSRHGTDAGPAYSNNGQLTSMCFNQALDEGLEGEDRKVDLKVTTGCGVIDVRFPIPDLRTSPPDGFSWWHRNLRDEVLTLELHNMTFGAQFGNSACTSLSITGSDFDVFFKLQAEKSKVLIAQVTTQNSNGDMEEDFNDWPRIEVSMYPTVSLLEQAPHLFQETPENSLKDIMDTPKFISSPFSQRQEFFHSQQDISGAEAGSGKDGTNVDTCKKVLPGDKQELQQWQDREASHTKLEIRVTLPQVTAYLHSKQLFEILYNRVNNDLLMWEPQAPSPLAQDNLYPGHSIHILHLLQQQGNAEAYEETAEPESESDDDTLPFLSSNYSRERIESEEGQTPQRQSKAVFALSIGQGKLLANVPIEDDGLNLKHAEINAQTKVEMNQFLLVGEDKKHGEILLSLEDAVLFSVVGHNGDSDLRQLSFQANHACVLHNGSVSRMQTPGNLAVVHDDASLPHLDSAIYKSKRGVLEGSWSKVGTGPDSLDMVTVALEIRLHPVDNMKDIIVAVGIHGATMRHKVVPSVNDLIHQVIEFLDVQDYPIIGYVDPKVVTAFHLHLTKCAVDYRPLNLPLKTLVMADTLSLNTNIVASSSKATSISFHLDDAALFLSKCRETIDSFDIDLRNDYIYVAGVDTFAFCIKFNPNKDAPKKEITIYSQHLEVMTCVDSFKALLDLINYIIAGGDLGDTEIPSNLVQSNTLSGSDDSGHSSLGGGSSALTEYELQHVASQMEDAMIDTESKTAARVEGSEDMQIGEGMREHYFTAPGSSTSPPLGVSPQSASTMSRSCDSMTSSVSEDNELQQDEDDDDFVIINSPGHRSGDAPVIVNISGEPLIIKENFFSKPLTSKDLLKAPDNFPVPESTFTLREMTIVWSVFAGKDLEKSRSSKAPRRTIPKSFENSSWRLRGGPKRNLCKMMELHLTKMRFQHETYPSTAEQASRWALSLEEVEVRNRMQGSTVNKLLSLLRHHDSITLHTNTPMFLLKVLFTRPDTSRPTQECSLKVSCQPIHLNVDQTTAIFLMKFFTDLNGGGEDVQEGRAESASPRDAAKPTLSSTPPAPYMSVENPAAEHSLWKSEHPREQPPLMTFEETGSGGPAAESQVPPAALEQADDQPIFIKSFVFSPEVPIMFSYMPKGRVEKSNVASYLAAMAYFNKTTIKLKRINFQNGYLGLSRLQEAVQREWIEDIVNNQVRDLVSGLGFMPIISQFLAGFKNLICMPIEQYQRDGRWVCGLQRGVNSFSTNTLMSIIEICTLTSRSLQFLLECTYDLVSPHDSVKNREGRKKKLIRRGQPSDIREGVTAAIAVVKEDSLDIYHNLSRAVQENHEQKGMAGAVGGVARELLPTTVKPFIMLTDASSTMLEGMRNQIRPAAKKEDEDKWREEEETLTITE